MGTKIRDAGTLDGASGRPGIAAAVSMESRPSGGRSTGSAFGISEEPGASSGGEDVEEDNGEEDLETEASRLLHNTVNIVADEMAEELEEEIPQQGGIMGEGSSGEDNDGDDKESNHSDGDDSDNNQEDSGEEGEG